MAGVAATSPWPATLTLHITDAAQAARVEKAISAPMPECCGYDIADLDLIAADAARLVEAIGADRPVLLVAVRSGGAYFAPLWRAALDDLGVSRSRWCSVRPWPTLSENESSAPDALRAPDRFGATGAIETTPATGLTCMPGMPDADAWLHGQPRPVVVVLDDQPDTGATMARVAAGLRAPDRELWFASVGKLWRDEAGQRRLAHAAPAWIGGGTRRLWECLMPPDHGRLLERLSRLPGLARLPSDAAPRWHCPRDEVRYGDARPWLPWNHPVVLTGRRPLVNPRKTPLAIAAADRRPLLHLRFIGEGVFGEAEFQRVQALQPGRRAWFIDGYGVTADIGPTTPLAERLRTCDGATRAALLDQCADLLSALMRDAIAETPSGEHGASHPGRMSGADGMSGTRAAVRMAGTGGMRDDIADAPPMFRTGEAPLGIETRWPAFARQLADRGLSLPETGEALHAFLARPVRRLGETGLALRTSLRHACGAWHWQIDAQARVHRFQLEANWGRISWPELEVAACLLALRLSAADGRRLAARCGLAWPAVRDTLPLAAATLGEAMLRGTRAFGVGGRARFMDDLRSLVAATGELAELETP